MPQSFIIASEHQAREVGAEIAQINQLLSSEQMLKSIVDGLPREVIDGVRKSLTTERRQLTSVLQAYENAKTGDFALLRQAAGADPGSLLIIARLMHGWSQKDLARKLGLREQAVQRYESERYRSISLTGLMRFARALGADVRIGLPDEARQAWRPIYEMTQTEAQKVLKHARDHGWIDVGDRSDENSIGIIKRYVAEHVGEHGVPSLLRTGLNVSDHSEDWALLSWKAQITRTARGIITEGKLKYRPAAYSWLKELVQLSRLKDGPTQARDLLRAHGIVLVIEPHIVGMNLDGAAFLVDEVPVIGMTLLRDALDNFWFTLLHEVAHVVLHYRTGLSSGFFDDIEKQDVDEFEDEANKFASNMLIPEELWSRSPARISKAPEPIEKLALQIGISSAIVFGRVRMERKNYKIFSDRIGRGEVRKQLLS